MFCTEAKVAKGGGVFARHYSYFFSEEASSVGVCVTGSATNRPLHISISLAQNFH